MSEYRLKTELGFCHKWKHKLLPENTKFVTYVFPKVFIKRDFDCFNPFVCEYTQITLGCVRNSHLALHLVEELVVFFQGVLPISAPLTKVTFFEGHFWVRVSVLEETLHFNQKLPTFGVFARDDSVWACG